MYKQCHASGGFVESKQNIFCNSVLHDSNRYFRLPGANWLPPINAFEQHGKLRPRQRYSSRFGLRPNEPAALEPLRKQTQAVAIKPKQFDQVASFAAKDEHVPGKRVLLQARLHECTQSGKTSPHVRDSGRNPDVCASRY
jgi:hypothetical protein